MLRKVVSLLATRNMLGIEPFLCAKSCCTALLTIRLTQLPNFCRIATKNNREFTRVVSRSDTLKKVLHRIADHPVNCVAELQPYGYIKYSEPKGCSWSDGYDELAKAIGVHAPVIGRYERAEVKRIIELAAKIA